MHLKVGKKSGASELFSLEKLFTSIIKAGGTVELAEDVAGSVAHALNDSVKGGAVASSEIRARTLALLRKADEKVAEAYSQFKKGK